MLFCESVLPIANCSTAFVKFGFKFFRKNTKEIKICVKRKKIIRTQNFIKRYINLRSLYGVEIFPCRV